MIIAMPCLDGVLFEHLGKSKSFVLYTINEGKIINKTLVAGEGEGHLAVTKLLKKYKVNTLICGHIGDPAIESISALGIDIYAGYEGNCDTLADDYSKGKLDEELEKNSQCCCGHHDEDSCSCSDSDEKCDCGCGK
jgi:Uncharacterized conserved protein